MGFGSRLGLGFGVRLKVGVRVKAACVSRSIQLPKMFSSDGSSLQASLAAKPAGDAAMR